MGGHTTLRGWSEPERTEKPDGGLINKMLNIEYRIQIREKWGTFIFIDSGTLYDKFNEISTSGIIWDYGLGMIYKTKLGPIRVDIAFPYGDTSEGQIHASLLHMF